MHISPVSGCIKKITVQGDKSISHRAVIIGSLAKGITKIYNFLEAEDTLNTVKIYKQMGVRIEKKGAIYYIHGNGLFSLHEPKNELYVGNSGTAIRLTLGVLAAQNFRASITGDAQIVKRPMNRVIKPLSEMGARFESNNGFAPVIVHGGSLKGIKYKMEIPSAQVKSAIILAALHANGPTEIIEDIKSRDHTERMLKHFGAKIKINNKKIMVIPGGFKANTVYVPGDISSAAYFIAAGAILKNSELTVLDVGLNPTRTGIIDVLKKMGAKISIKNKKIKNNEPLGNIVIRSSKLKGIVIKGNIIPRVIDEIPIISILAAFANGRTIISDAEELRVKETDRIFTIVRNLKRLGVKVEERKDGMIIHGNGGKPFKYVDIDSFGDHRIAMAFSIAALVSDNGLLIKDTECVNTSFPGFFDIIRELKK
ncbi:MAG: 3-phosphoshikimate 1-carboxyvinyltransferase [Candidatus Goldbacteria bacterium]|nr:3-phosphoshikimate 1-carboxyvinyltransferase [Candidatus Goldiibacteriota bacterium]